MLPLVLAARSSPLTILCIGAHSDDIEIGCGGTILRLLEERPGTAVHWVVLGADPLRAREARRSATRMLRRAGSRKVRIESFRDSYMPWQGAAVKDVFEDLATSIQPDLVFTHCRDDAHQDHRLVAELTWNTFRGHTILEYEIPKYDGDLGRPNVFVPLPSRTRRAKLRILMSVFASQHHKPWFTESTFDGLMRLRGIECGAAEGHAEAFHCRKLILSPAAAD